MHLTAVVEPLPSLMTAGEGEEVVGVLDAGPWEDIGHAVHLGAHYPYLLHNFFHSLFTTLTLFVIGAHELCQLVEQPDIKLSLLFEYPFEYDWVHSFLALLGRHQKPHHVPKIPLVLLPHILLLAVLHQEQHHRQLHLQAGQRLLGLTERLTLREVKERLGDRQFVGEYQLPGLLEIEVHVEMLLVVIRGPLFHVFLRLSIRFPVHRPVINDYNKALLPWACYYKSVMIGSRGMSVLENQRFRAKLEENSPNYAYEVLLLEIIVEDDQYPRKPTIEEISRLIQLYMVAVEVLEGAADTRYDYFKRKIHSLMLKKHIVEQMHKAAGKNVDQKTLKECAKADLETRKNEHEAQVFFNKTDNTKVQEILKRAQQQVKTLNLNIRKNIMSQEATLEERIRSRKKKSECGSSVGKFKIESHNAQAGKEQLKSRPDPRMEYFEDYSGPSSPAQPNSKLTGSSRNIRALYGSADKVPKTRDYM